MTYIRDILETLTEAKDALEKLPELRDEVRTERETNLHLFETLRERESTINKLQAIVSDLESKVRSLEVERDDASFRELETAERLNAAKARLQAIIGSATDVLAEVEPKMVESSMIAQEMDTVVHDSNLPEFVGKSKTDTVAPPEPLAEMHIPDYVPQPYRGIRVWDRPDGVSWDDFVNGGGEAPNWYVPNKN